MSVIKCKMCGGELNLTEGVSTAECEYCGSVQTIPNLDDEKKLVQFERAERLRKQCEFDKAAGIYETIVADFRQEAEAYWGLVLCKYGIEYVDDPATGKKVPTCHRSSFDSIMEDSDFEQVLENADPAARRVYREEAKQIEEIRKGIIAVSSNEAPYDIFICYKETAENGDRTLDSVLAQDVYDALTDKGYRVFFSRITLEDKLGMEYEPYIFAALNSAKIMLAFGTDYEYFNAVWVKNEWSRFLKLMAKDKDKHLIPCFKGIDAYDMPKEFARLQAQDLGKVGAIQDLLRGVEKLLPRQAEVKTVVQERVVVGGSGDNKIASLLDRGNMALEDGDWDKADSFFEDVLNNDSKNAQAYLGKTLAQERCRTIDAFVRKRKERTLKVSGSTLSLSADNVHINAMAEKYSIPGYVSQEEIRKLYTFTLSYHSNVSERQQQYKDEENYWKNHKLLSRAEQFAVGAVAENLQREKKALFAALTDRVKKAMEAADAERKNVQERYAAHIKEADEKAEKVYNAGFANRDAHYQNLVNTAENNTYVSQLESTAKQLDQLGDYLESKKFAELCRKRAAEEQAKIDAEKALKAQRAKEAEERFLCRMKKVALIVLAVVVAISAVVLVITQIVIPAGKYDEAVALLNAGQYEDAAVAFDAIGNYKDAKEKGQEARYHIAVALAENGQYEEAVEIFEVLGGYEDSQAKIDQCFKAIIEEKCNQAIALIKEGKHEEGKAILAELIDSAESDEEINQYNYMAAAALRDAGYTAQAAIAFGKIATYSDAKEQSLALWDQCAVRSHIAAEGYATLGIKTDGTIMVSDGTQDWTDIIAIDSELFNTVGLKSDGTVVSAAMNNYGEAAVTDWTDIVAVSAGDWHTIGLKLDGTAVAAGVCHDYGQCDVTGLADLIAISTESYHTICLKTDGTVVALGNNEHGECNVSGWKDIVAVGTGHCHSVGLRSDGTVVATGHNDYGQCDVSAWTDIVAISVGDFQTLGLRSDGTVVATGNNYYGECKVSGWSNVVEIFCGGNHSVGLKADGTLVATGYNKQGQCNLSKWKNIKVD